MLSGTPASIAVDRPPLLAEMPEKQDVLKPMCARPKTIIA
jgi:hypothetical protein